MNGQEIYSYKYNISLLIMIILILITNDIINLNIICIYLGRLGWNLVTHYMWGVGEREAWEYMGFLLGQLCGFKLLMCINLGMAGRELVEARMFRVSLSQVTIYIKGTQRTSPRVM